VALKVPRAEALVSPEARERFLREARAAAGLDHPNVVPVYEAGEVNSVCYIASAYCPGTTLAQWLKQRDEPVPAREAAALVAALADGVEHAHSRGVVHRDLKPSNVLLVREGEASREGEAPAEPQRRGSAGTSPSPGTPKITDFGLAKLLEGEPGASATGVQTESGAIVGTPAYMAPEQAGGHTREVGPAADVYALGAILYEVLTGRPPFQGESTLDVLLQVRTQEPVPPGSLRARLPRDVETICLKCLEKTPAKRYATAQSLADDLRRFLEGRPIQARPVGRGERLWRWCRRNPWVAGLSAAVAFSLLAGAALSLWQAGEAIRERDEKLLAVEDARIKDQQAHDAAVAESKAQAAADAQRGQAEAVADLLEALFYEPHPDHLTRDFRGQLVWRLQKVADRLEEKYAGDPVVRARLRTALGQTYMSLGWFQKAAAQCEKALEERRAHLRPDHPDTLLSMNCLAEAYRMDGRLDKALPLLEQVLPKMKAELGPTIPPRSPS
jgi:hypothetical protein